MTARPWSVRIQWFLARLALGTMNAFIDLFIGGRRRPAFFDPTGTVPDLQKIIDRRDAIRGEFDRLFASREKLPCYHELDPHMTRIAGETDPDKHWKVFLIYAMGGVPERARAECPITTATLLSLPGLFQAFFSILDPGKSVPPHEGPYRGYLRYHLGLRVPRSRPPRLRVRDREYVWKEGESVLFDDSWDHEVLNDSDEPRGILIVDVLRPLPALADRLNRMFSYGVVSLVYGRRLVKNFR